MAICLSPNKCNKVTILEKRDNIIKFNVFVKFFKFAAMPAPS